MTREKIFSNIKTKEENIWKSLKFCQKSHKPILAGTHAYTQIWICIREEQDKKEAAAGGRKRGRRHTKRMPETIFIFCVRTKVCNIKFTLTLGSSAAAAAWTEVDECQRAMRVCARAPVRVKQRAVLPEGNKKQDIPIKMQPLGSKLLIAN